MNDDFNSPIAIAELFEAARIINSIHDGNAKITAQQLDELNSLVQNFVYDILGLKEETSQTEDLSEIMELIIKLRLEAKTNKDYVTSDKIRIGLQEIGIQLKDGKEGTTWGKA